MGNATNIGGASGSFFFFTEDKNYIVKTMSDDELKVMINLAPNLVKHFQQLGAYGSKSSIARIYGIFQFKLEGSKRINLMLMKNALVRKHMFSNIHFRFDLKGSSINRQVLPNEEDMSAFTIGSFGAKFVLKDQDFRYITKFKKSDLVNISLDDKHRIMTKIKHDSAFLESNGIMDYSLLLAVETNYTGDTFEETEKKEQYEHWDQQFFNDGFDVSRK